MSRIPSSWLATCMTVFLGIILACAALIAFPHDFFVKFGPGPAALQPATPAPSLAAVLPPVTGTQCPNGGCAKACLARLNSIQQNSGSGDARPKAAGQSPLGLPATVLATYPVNGDQLGDPQLAPNVPPALSSMQQDTIDQKKIWDYFAAIIPAADRTELAYYIVATDGKDGMLASVEQYSGSSDIWALVVDPADASQPRDLTFTLLHEFGHLLTLNDSQVRPNQAVLEHPGDLQIYKQEAAACPRYFASGGCSRSNSYINQFFDEFWTGLFSQWTTVNAARNDPNYLSLLAHFYGQHRTQFITPYASTSPEEDMAETWAYFVLNPKPAEDSVAHRKVLFYYSFPQLVDLRSRIISGICSYAASQ